MIMDKMLNLWSKTMKLKFLIGVLAVVTGVVGVVLVLTNGNALVVHPKGVIAQNELELIITNILLMLLIIVLTYILLFSVVWKYCIKKEKTKYDPDHTYGPVGELIMWGLPSIVVVAMAIVTWDAT